MGGVLRTKEGCYNRDEAVGNPSGARIFAYALETVGWDAEPFSAELDRRGGACRILDGDLPAILGRARPGDVLVVPSLDHFGISMWRVFEVLGDLRRRGIVFVSVAEGIDTSLPHVEAALAIMGSMLDAERRFMARRRDEAASPRSEPRDPLLERSREAAAPWIEMVREHRPHLAWDRLVERVAASGADVTGLSSGHMRRHVRRLVEAGDLPPSVMGRAAPDRAVEIDRAARRAREMAEEVPSPSLREIGVRLVGEGLLPPRAEAWSAQTVKRLMD